MDEPATAILHSTASPGEAPTRAQIRMTDQTSVLPVEAATRAQINTTNETAILPVWFPLVI